MVNAGALRVRLLGTLGSDSSVTGVTTGISQPTNVANYTNLTVYLTASAALSAGTLLIEEADYDPNQQEIYSGTWSLIATETLSSVFASAGGTAGIHLQTGAYAFVRVRIGTTVVGGTLAAVLRGI